MLNSKTLVGLLACLSVVRAGPCKPSTTQVTSATTRQSTSIDFTSTIATSTTEVASASTTELSSKTTEQSASDVSITTKEASTTTQEATTTTTAATCPTPDSSCSNLGLQWAYFVNGADNNDATYSDFDPAAFKTDPSAYVGTTRQIGGLFENPNGVSGPIYGSSDLPLDHFALNHGGYFYSCTAGVYTFKISYAKEAVYAWVSGFAYAFYTKGNADAAATYNEPDSFSGTATFTVSLAAHVYIPIRLVFGQGQYGGGGFDFSIQILTDRFL